MLTSRLAARLRRARLERGLTLRQAATQTGVTKETLSDLERARRQPHPPTLHKIAEGYGVEIRDLLGPIAEVEPSVSGKAEAPRETGPAVEDASEQGGLAHLSVWSSFLNELAGDIEEWKYAELGEVMDPADLPERDFLLFIGGAARLGQTYQRISRIVREELVPVLKTESQASQADAELERFSRAFQRLSRVMLSVVTKSVEQRVERMASEEAVPSKVVQLFAETRGYAKAV